MDFSTASFLCRIVARGNGFGLHTSSHKITVASTQAWPLMSLLVTLHACNPQFVVTL
jgi:hypothetical protein